MSHVRAKLRIEDLGRLAEAVGRDAALYAPRAGPRGGRAGLRGGRRGRARPARLRQHASARSRAVPAPDARCCSPTSGTQVTRGPRAAGAAGRLRRAALRRAGDGPPGHGLRHPRTRASRTPTSCSGGESAVVVALACSAPAPPASAPPWAGSPAGPGGRRRRSPAGLRGPAAAGGRDGQGPGPPGRARRPARPPPRRRDEAARRRGAAAGSRCCPPRCRRPAGAARRSWSAAFDDPLWEETDAHLHRLRRLHLPVPHLPLLRHRRRDRRLDKGRAHPHLGLLPVPPFTKHASGHNPRENKKERMRQRFMHKFSYTVEKTGTPVCVGCGRCMPPAR